MITYVHVWSHRLHHESIEMLKDIYGPNIEIVNILYHSENRESIQDEVEAILNKLKAAGKMEGRVVMSLPSIAIATFLAVAGTFRETGIWPDAINLRMDKGGKYLPSFQLPVIEGRAFTDKRRRARAN